MAERFYAYGKLGIALLNGLIDFTDHTIKVMLVSSSYTPDRTAHDYVDDVRAHEIAASGGYETGGQALTNKSVTYVAAASAAAWQAETAYEVGDIVRPTTPNGHCYRCIVAGTSGVTEPADWPTVNGQNVTDGGVTWDEIGAGYVVVDADSVSWNPSTITARYAIMYDDTPEGDANKPLIGYADPEEELKSKNSEWTLNWNDGGILRLPAA